jgi:hypothetical protein
VFSKASHSIVGAVTSVGRKNTVVDIAENTENKRNNLFKSESKEREREREKEKENDAISRFVNIDMNSSNRSGYSEISESKISIENNGISLTRDSITGSRFLNSVRTVQVLESPDEILESTQGLDDNSSREFLDSPTSTIFSSIVFDDDDDERSETDICLEIGKKGLMEELEEEENEEEENENEEDLFEKDGPLVMKEIGDEETEWEVEVRNAVVNCPVENRQYHSYF